MALVESAGAAWATNAGNSVTSGSYTPTANLLQVALCCLGNGNNGTIASPAISDTASGSWTLLASAVTTTGPGAWVYCKDAGASPAAQTVTFGLTAGVDNTGIIVRQFASAKPAAQQNGVTASTGSSAVTAVTKAITPLTTGSQVVGAYGFSTTGRAVTANAATSIYGQNTITSNDTIASLEAVSLSTASTPITLGWTNATGGSNCFALAEILPSVAVLAAASTSLQAVKRAAYY